MRKTLTQHQIDELQNSALNRLEEKIAEKQYDRKELSKSIIVRDVDMNTDDFEDYKRLKHRNQSDFSTGYVLKEGELQTKDYNRVNPRLTKRQKELVDQSYLKSLIVPELSYDAKIPSHFPQPTHAFHTHITINVPVGNTGELYLLWFPYYLGTDLTINNFYYNTISAETTGGANGWQAFELMMNLPTSTCSTYRVVSGSIQLSPSVSVLNSAGYIAGGVGTAPVFRSTDVPFTGGQGSINSLPQAQLPAVFMTANSKSIIDNLMYFSRANIQQQETLRHILLPLDDSYTQFRSINQGHSGLQDISTTGVQTPVTLIGGSETFLNFYLTGLPTGAYVRVDMYMNFEITPSPNAYAILSPSLKQTTENYEQSVQLVATTPSLVAHASKEMDKEIQTKNDTSSSFWSDLWGITKELLPSVIKMFA